MPETTTKKGKKKAFVIDECFHNSI